MPKQKLSHTETIFTITVITIAVISGPILFAAYLLGGAVFLKEKGVKVPNTSILLTYYWLIWWPYIIDKVDKDER